MVTCDLPVDELIRLFTGVHDPDGGWETTPVPSAELITAVCRQLRPASLGALTVELWRAEPEHMPSFRETLALTEGFDAWRAERRRGRGL